MAALPEFQAAKWVKVNPDSPQREVWTVSSYLKNRGSCHGSKGREDALGAATKAG